MSRVTRVFLLPLLAFSFSRPGLAQSAPRDARSESVARLREADRLAAAGSSALACEQYGESYSLDAQLDALMPWAACLEKSGKLASAYGAFLDAAALGRRASDPRWVTADARAAALKPRLNYLTIEVPLANRLPALQVERDGFRLGSSTWGVPVPVDPGSHVIVVRADGYRVWQTRVDVLSDGAAPYIEVPLLEKSANDAGTTVAPSPAVVAPPPAAANVGPTAAEPVVGIPPAPAARAAAPTAPPQPSGSPPGKSAGLPPTRVAALIAGGASLLSLGFGFYFVGKTHSALSERDGICPSGKDCEPGTNVRLAELTQTAVARQRDEIICFALSGAAAAFGAALWFLPKHQKQSDRAALLTPVATPNGGGLLLRGGF